MPHATASLLEPPQSPLRPLQEKPLDLYTPPRTFTPLWYPTAGAPRRLQAAGAERSAAREWRRAAPPLRRRGGSGAAQSEKEGGGR